MNDLAMELLTFARGPGFVAAVAILAFGLAFRVASILMLGRKPDLSVARQDPVGPGLRMIWRRFFSTPGMFEAAPLVHVAGHVFHFGLLIVLVLYIPHIEIFKALLGFGWPGLPSPVIDAVTVITLVALLMLLVSRLRHPVRRLLSTPQDYIVWALTVLPLATGYMAFHRLLFPYDWLLAVHILSAELLLAAIPFTRLSHAVTLFIARYYNGAIAGRKGVAT